MPIDVQCPACGGKLHAADSLRGKRGKCPKCSAVIEVGDVGQRAPVPRSTPVQKPPPTSAVPTSRTTSSEDDHDFFCSFVTTPTAQETRPAATRTESHGRPAPVQAPSAAASAGTPGTASHEHDSNSAPNPPAGTRTQGTSTLFHGFVANVPVGLSERLLFTQLPSGSMRNATLSISDDAAIQIQCSDRIGDKHILAQISRDDIAQVCYEELSRPLQRKLEMIHYAGRGVAVGIMVAVASVTQMAPPLRSHVSTLFLLIAEVAGGALLGFLWGAARSGVLEAALTSFSFYAHAGTAANFAIPSAQLRALLGALQEKGYVPIRKRRDLPSACTQLRCPHCAQRFEVALTRDSVAGEVRCPSCSTTLRMPRVDPTSQTRVR